MFNLLLINYYSWDDVFRIVSEFYHCDKVSKILIIDNSHENEELSRFIKYIDKLVIISALNNSGYSGGNNIGLWALSKNRIKGDIVVSNSNINISSDVISYASEVFHKNKEIGQLYFQTCDIEGKLMYNTIHLNGLLQKWNITRNTTELTPSDYAAGSFFFIRRNIVDLYERIFDEQYFMYWEEVELSWRVKSNGYQVVCSDRYNVIRDNNSSKAVINSVYYIIRNSFIIKKMLNVSFFDNFSFLLKMSLTAIRLSFKNKKLRPLLAFIIGVIHGLQGVSGKNEKIHK